VKVLASRIIVPDASVILKWVFTGAEEKDREQADAIRSGWLDGRLEIVLPRHWAFEVGNVIALKDPGRAGELMDVLIGYRCAEEETTPDLCRTAFGLTRDFGVTFYDAAYHAVALRRNGTFVTADESYCRKVSRKGGVALLRDCGPDLA
ncbi:MAG: type II toxin-antitoxin system VapC family toxin, partial [Deltaproteobacteria bacterium]|nr:type II toxin-antitoxin system VapC family toxin [Deltaproteobacteria bacterium]